MGGIHSRRNNTLGSDQITVYHKDASIFSSGAQRQLLGMWEVTDDIRVGENTQRKLVEWVKKKKKHTKQLTDGNPRNFDFQKSGWRNKNKTNKQQK